ncbi:hypothetical protein [uncultured Fibrobacter sp.]|uniref:hypothetical protein n=1 Tax=uncultured Fibrobacter sp. TaxID=261512 RepID=UPI0025D08D91|nr:hypothetical protein [uncultured Fibrobacter sp.]
MNIRKFWRLSCLTVASLFWASCGSDSNPQFAVAQSTNPDSSADAFGDSSSSETAFPEESSSSVTEENTSSSEGVASSSSDAAMSSSNIESSSSADVTESSSSSEPVKYLMARDTSVTCVEGTYKQSNCPETTHSPTCDDYKKYLGKDTSLSQKILTEWEDKLQSCGSIQEMAPVYGIVSSGCYPTSYYDAPMIVCSDTRTYRNGYKIEGNLFYTSDEEYDIAHGIYPEDWVKSCKQDGFALFPDILADVQKKLYEVVSGKLLEDVVRSESEQKYLNGLLDHENKTLKGLYEPYFSADIDADVFLLKDYTKHWFNGFIAKTKACADGTPEITKRYQDMYDAILAECLEIIEKKSKAAE